MCAGQISMHLNNSKWTNDRFWSIANADRTNTFPRVFFLTLVWPYKDPEQSRMCVKFKWAIKLSLFNLRHKQIMYQQNWNWICKCDFYSKFKKKYIVYKLRIIYMYKIKFLLSVFWTLSKNTRLWPIRWSSRPISLSIIYKNTYVDIQRTSR